MRPRYHNGMATKRKIKSEEEYEAELRSYLAKRKNPIPRRNPKSGPPLYVAYEGGAIPFEELLAWAKAAHAKRGKSAK